MDEKTKKPTTPAEEEIEFHPDGWARFERFVKRIAKAGPQHRASKAVVAKPKRKPAKGKHKRPS